MSVTMFCIICLIVSTLTCCWSAHSSFTHHCEVAGAAPGVGEKHPAHVATAGDVSPHHTREEGGKALNYEMKWLVDG